MVNERFQTIPLDPLVYPPTLAAGPMRAVRAPPV
jgi:hypothetical protein